MGEIGYGARLTEEYQSDYFDKLIPRLKGKRLKLACDFGYGTLGAFFPMMLGKMGIESINLNSYSDAKKAPRTPDEIRTHMENLRQITNTLECDFGVLFFDEGERLSLVDLAGDHAGGLLFSVLHSGFDAMACLGKLIEMLQCLDVTLLQVVDTLSKLDI